MKQAVLGAHRPASQAELASLKAVRERGARMTAEVDVWSSSKCEHTLAHLHTSRHRHKPKHIALILKPLGAE